MKKLLLVPVLALLVASPASAKELSKVAVCGPDGCNAVSGAANLRTFPTGGGPIPTGRIPLPAAYYQIRFTIDHGAYSWTSWYVPSTRMLASVDEREGITWTPFPTPALAKLTGGLKPFPTPEVTSVTVGTKKVRNDPGSYLRLLSLPSAGSTIPQGLPDWEPIVFTSKRPSPWTTGTPSLYYSPAHGLLQRGIDVVKLPPWAAADVRAGDPLAPPGFPWRKLLLALAAAAALIATAAAVRPLRRRLLLRRRPTPA